MRSHSGARVFINAFMSLNSRPLVPFVALDLSDCGTIAIFREWSATLGGGGSAPDASLRAHRSRLNKLKTMLRASLPADKVAEIW